jgi:hypothetical protein
MGFSDGAHEWLFVGVFELLEWLVASVAVFAANLIFRGVREIIAEYLMWCPFLWVTALNVAWALVF